MSDLSAGIISFTWVPGLALISAAFSGLADDLGKYDEPLRKSVSEVAAPSIATNFAVGGRPPWEQDSDATVSGSHGWSGLMIRSGALMDAAGSEDVWTIDGSQGAALLDNMPEDVYYGAIHQDGWIFGPARPWAELQEEDEAAIEEVFGRWLDAKIVERL